MSSSAGVNAGLGQIGIETARSHADLIIEEFPDPDQKFRRLELESHAAKRHLVKLVEQDVVNIVEDTGDFLRYRVDRRAHAAAQRVLETRDPMLPCGHSGMINLRDGRGFVCSYWVCTEIFDRQEIADWRAEQ